MSSRIARALAVGSAVALTLGCLSSCALMVDPPIDGAGSSRGAPAPGHHRDSIADTRAMAMSDGKFWSYIQTLQGDVNEESVDELSDRLALLPRDQLIGFEAALTLKLYELDTPTTWKWDRRHDPEAVQLGVLDDDSFLYARCATVAAGRKTFDRAIATGTLPSKEHDPGAAELLLSASGEAARQDGYRWHFDEIPLSYETGSNREAWAR